MAGITRDTADPPKGRLFVIPKRVRLRERWKNPLRTWWQRFFPSRLARSTLGRFARHEVANQNGITRVHSAGQDFEVLVFSDEMRRRGDSGAHVLAYFLTHTELRPAYLLTRSSTRAEIFTMTGLMLAPSIHGGWRREAHTAAMLEPYSDDPSLKGSMTTMFR